MNTKYSKKIFNLVCQLFLVNCLFALLCVQPLIAATDLETDIAVIDSTGHTRGNFTLRPDGYVDRLGVFYPLTDPLPYVLTNNMYIKGTHVMTITTEKGGVGGGHDNIELQIGGGNFIQVGKNISGGRLVATGTLTETVKFSASGSKWGEITFTELAGLSTLENCILENGGSTQNSNRKAMVSIESTPGTVTLDNCTIQGSSLNGIYVEESSPHIINCTIIANEENGIFTNSAPAGSINTRPFIQGCTIGGIDSPNTLHGILIESGSVRINGTIIENCLIDKNGSYGVYCDQGNYDKCLPEIRGGNTFSNSGGHPIRIPAQITLHETNTFTGENDVIEFGRGTINQDTTWYNFGIPYISGYITLWSNDPVLEIKKGTIVKVNPEQEIRIYEGNLIAEGTKEEPITFTTSTPGQYWKGIYFNDANSKCSMEHCVVEYGGYEHTPAIPYWNGNIRFNEGGYPNPGNVKISECTIRYSITNGIARATKQTNSHIHNCNIYGNAQYDIIVWDGIAFSAELNFWGTPNGPSDDLCSSAVVSAGVTYEAWLEEEFTEDLKFNSAGADPQAFVPFIGSTDIDFTLSASADWTLTLLNSQFERIWSTSGNGTSGDITWNGMTDYGAASGICYYRIEAQNSNGKASPAMGRLVLGDESKAKIAEPVSGTLYETGDTIDINGIASLTGGTYTLSYGEGANPDPWIDIVTDQTADIGSVDLLGSLSTSTFTFTTCTIKLVVTDGSKIYSDVARVNFYKEDPLPGAGTATIFEYDSHGRLKKATYPDLSSVAYTYDKVGNRSTVTRLGPPPPLRVMKSRASSRKKVIRGHFNSGVFKKSFNCD